MRLLAIASKSLKERMRNRNVLGIQLAFPAVFMLVFGIAFSLGGLGKNQPYDVLIINEDRGTFLDHAGTNFSYGEDLTGLIRGVTFENSTLPMFKLSNGTKEESRDMLMDRKVACVVVIPPEFSEAMEALANATIRRALTSLVGEGVVPASEAILPVKGQVDATVRIEGDFGYMAFGAAQALLRGILDAYIRGVQAQAIESALRYFPDVPGPDDPQDHVFTEVVSVSGTKMSTAFDYFAPGIMIFGLLLGVMSVAESLAKEVEEKTLSRLKISLMTSFDYLAGSLLSWTLFGAFQVFMLFAVAVAIGFNWVGGLGSLSVAIFIGCLVAISSVALGMLIAGFAKNQEQASSLATLIAVPMSFVVGVFIAFPPGLFTELTGLLPWRQGLVGLLQSLTYGAKFGKVLPNIVAIGVETAVLFAVGLFVFSRKKMQAE